MLAYYEHILNDSLIGASARYIQTAQISIELSGNGQFQSVGAESSPDLILEAYTRVPCGFGVVLASFDYLMTLGNKFGSNGGDNIDSRGGVDFNVGYRIAF